MPVIWRNCCLHKSEGVAVIVITVERELIPVASDGLGIGFCAPALQPRDILIGTTRSCEYVYGIYIVDGSPPVLQGCLVIVAVVRGSVGLYPEGANWSKGIVAPTESPLNTGIIIKANPAWFDFHTVRMADYRMPQESALHLSAHFCADSPSCIRSPSCSALARSLARF
jgi:hypothetical protein